MNAVTVLRNKILLTIFNLLKSENNLSNIFHFQINCGLDVLVCLHYLHYSNSCIIF